MNQLELNRHRAEIMLGAKYDEDGECINIESRSTTHADIWGENSNPEWDWDYYDYRLIPEPKEPVYKPYEKVDEAWLGRTVKAKDGSIDTIILAIQHTNNKVWIANDGQWGLEYLFRHFTWQDGTPFGEIAE